jgi:hypothetical protein
MIRAILLPHIAAAIIVTVLSGLVYVSVQQQYRSSANDPQIQAARDFAFKPGQSWAATDVIVPDTVNLEQSLSPFVQWYNDAGKLTYSTGFIGPKAPEIPAGVLAAARANGEYSVTWQPQRNVRLASVIVYTARPQTGYVLVARSLWETEKRESNLLIMTFACWLLCIGTIGVHALIQGYWAKKEQAKS